MPAPHSFDGFNAMLGTLRLFILFFVPTKTRAYEPKVMWLCPRFGLDLPKTMFAGLRVLETPLLGGNALIQYIVYSAKKKQHYLGVFGEW